jgi:hypothetical protein
MGFAPLVLAAVAVTLASAARIPSTPTLTASALKSSSSPGSKFECGVKGYGKIDSYDYNGTAAIISLSSCGAKCKADSQCVSFAFGPGYCLKYKQTVYERFLVGDHSRC